MSIVSGLYTKMDNDFLIEEENPYNVVVDYFVKKFHSIKYSVFTINDLLEELNITERRRKESAIEEIKKSLDYYEIYDKLGEKLNIKDIKPKTRLYIIDRDCFKGDIFIGVESNYTPIVDISVSKLLVESTGVPDKINLLRFYLRCCRITNTIEGIGYLPFSKCGLKKHEKLKEFQNACEKSEVLWFMNVKGENNSNFSTRVCNPNTLRFDDNSKFMYCCKEEFEEYINEQVRNKKIKQ